MKIPFHRPIFQIRQSMMLNLCYHQMVTTGKITHLFEQKLRNILMLKMW